MESSGHSSLAQDLRYTTAPTQTAGNSPTGGLLTVTTKEMTAQALQFISDIQSLPHAIPSEEVLQALRVNEQLGLGAATVGARRAQYGPNSIQSIRPRAAWRALLGQFASLVVALLAAAIVALLTGERR